MASQSLSEKIPDKIVCHFYKQIFCSKCSKMLQITYNCSDGSYAPLNMCIVQQTFLLIVDDTICIHINATQDYERMHYTVFCISRKRKRVKYHVRLHGDAKKKYGGSCLHSCNFWVLSFHIISICFLNNNWVIQTKTSNHIAANNF